MSVLDLAPFREDLAAREPTAEERALLDGVHLIVPVDREHCRPGLIFRPYFSSSIGAYSFIRALGLGDGRVLLLAHGHLFLGERSSAGDPLLLDPLAPFPEMAATGIAVTADETRALVSMQCHGAVQCGALIELAIDAGGLQVIGTSTLSANADFDDVAVAPDGTVVIGSAPLLVRAPGSSEFTTVILPGGDAELIVERVLSTTSGEYPFVIVAAERAFAGDPLRGELSRHVFTSDFPPNLERAAIDPQLTVWLAGDRGDLYRWTPATGEGGAVEVPCGPPPTVRACFIGPTEQAPITDLIAHGDHLYAALSCTGALAIRRSDLCSAGVAFEGMPVAPVESGLRARAFTVVAGRVIVAGEGGLVAIAE